MPPTPSLRMISNSARRVGMSRASGFMPDLPFESYPSSRPPVLGTTHPTTTSGKNMLCYWIGLHENLDSRPGRRVVTSRPLTRGTGSFQSPKHLTETSNAIQLGRCSSGAYVYGSSHRPGREEETEGARWPLDGGGRRSRG